MFRQGFQTCIFFRPANIQMKNPFAKMCTLLFIFCTLNRKKWTAAEIISEGASKLPFPCPEDLFAKHSFSWKTYNFSVTFSIEPIKLRFSAKSLQQICQNCIIWCPRNTPMKANFTEKVTILFQLFRILSQKNLDFSKNVSVVLSKLHFSFPVNTFGKNQLVKWIQISRRL